MKKSILLITVMLLTGLCAGAVDWQPVRTSAIDTEVYIDLDSIRYNDNNECLYAIKYRAGNQPEKIAYLKSDFKNDYIGIIRTGDIDDKYRPNLNLNNPHVLMKSVNKNSFLNDVQKYAMLISSNSVAAEKANFDKTEFPAVYTSEKPMLRDNLLVASRTQIAPVTNEYIQAYIAQTSNKIEQNWRPPVSTRGTRTIVILTIGADGSLLNCNIVEPSGDNNIDNSIITAIEKSVPYDKLPDIGEDVYSMDFRFVFEHDFLKKSVVY